MLSVFPSLLYLSQLSPFMIRVTLGAVFIYWAYRNFFKKDLSVQAKVVAILEVVCGILLVIGLWTQIAALIIAIDLLVRLYERIMAHAFLTGGVNYYLILLVMAVSLLFTGAGFLAFDLPL